MCKRGKGESSQGQKEEAGAGAGWVEVILGGVWWKGWRGESGEWGRRGAGRNKRGEEEAGEGMGKSVMGR